MGRCFLTFRFDSKDPAWSNFDFVSYFIISCYLVRVTLALIIIIIIIIIIPQTGPWPVGVLAD